MSMAACTCSCGSSMSVTQAMKLEPVFIRPARRLGAQSQRAKIAD